MEENPYEAPKVPGEQESKPETPSNTLARLVVLLVIGAIVAFLPVQLWAATAPRSPF